MDSTEIALSDESISRIARDVLDTTYPYSEWGHAAHFAVALWLLRHPDVLAAQGGIKAILRRYNVSVGIPDVPTRGYHETITAASMRAAAWFLAKHDEGTTLATVLADLMSSEPGEPNWLLAYWSKPLLESLRAQREWLEPDLLPFPY